jgi:uroporphyrinogen III methyltransferase / synthase
MGPPAIVVIGAVAGLDVRPPAPPLSGQTVVVTRARKQAEALVEALAAAGATVVTLPVIAIAPPADPLALEEAARRAGDYDWIVFTSANAVESFVSRLRDGRALGGVRLAAVGPATVAALAKRHLVADLVPPSANADAVVAALPGPGGRILFPRAAEARDVIGRGLRARGWRVDEVESYRTVPLTKEGVGAEALTEALAADVVTFTSPSTVGAFLAMTGGAVAAGVACIGPTTAEAAAAAGLTVDAVAEDQSDGGLVAAVVARWGRTGPGVPR